MDIKLALMTGVDIPIPECRLILHQPSLLEIGMLGEKQFFSAIQLLCINKNMLEGEEQPIDLSNFQIVMQLLKEDREKKHLIKNTMLILFPQYTITITPFGFSFILNEETITLDEGTYNSFQEVIRQVFCLYETGKDAFNPEGEKAKEIADKLLRARKRVAAQKAATEGETSLGQYISIIPIAIPSMSLKDTISLTLYQLYNLLERYGLYANWDLDIRARLAGAKNDKPIENWMRPLH